MPDPLGMSSVILLFQKFTFLVTNLSILLLLYSTLWVGGVCSLIMWWHTFVQLAGGKRPKAALFVFSGAVLCDLFASWSYRTDGASPPWEKIFDDPSKTFFWACLFANVLLLVTSVILARKGPKLVKTCTWVLFAVEGSQILSLVLDLLP